jgi:hypothetical protein
MEFSAYGAYRSVVEQMVNHDVPEHIITHFYESLSRDNIAVDYIPNFEDAIDYLLCQDSSIVSTLIELIHCSTREVSRHAVCLVKDGEDYYLFDPNGSNGGTNDLTGSIDSRCSNSSRDYVYRYFGRECTIYELARELSLAYNIELNFQPGNGVQYYGPNHKDSNFINHGGYCMFYNYCFIEWLTTHWVKNSVLDTILSKIHVDYAYSTGIFPPNAVLPRYTLGVIYHAFDRH